MPDTSFNWLAIDAGNTRIKWGVRSSAMWQALGAVPTADLARLGDSWRSLPGIDRAIASNVAGSQVEAELQRACDAGGIRLEIIRSQPLQLGVTNEYMDPSQLGSDRWAALIAAHHAAKGHKLVVNAGTALTVDALTADGRFRGGMIVPGPALMRRALDQGTARLRETEGHFADFPRSTPDAVSTGAIAACAGAVRQFADTMAHAGSPPAVIILSGGAAGEIAAHLPIPPTIHENLVLEGLFLIARNR